MKTIFGITKTLCEIVERVSEKIHTTDEIIPYYNDFVTTHYKMSCYKSITNYFFLLITHVNTPNMNLLLEKTY
jgi:2-phospho-L-lactate transferase/gluconeogenesis factor (CofD/UPF0052 family)